MKRTKDEIKQDKFREIKNKEYKEWLSKQDIVIDGLIEIVGISGAVDYAININKGEK